MHDQNVILAISVDSTFDLFVETIKDIYKALL
jgi:hypothetical protein